MAWPVLAAVLAASLLVDPLEAGAGEEVLPAGVGALLRQYCLDCHGHDEPSGEVRLTDELSIEDVQGEARNWNKVVRVVRYHEMPPAEMDQPTDDERRMLFEWVDATLEVTAALDPADPGRPTLRRLNRVELRYTVRDLLGATSDFTRDLPSDPSAYSFDNIGDVLFTSPVLLEKYLDAFRLVLDEVYANDEQKQRLLVEPSDELPPLEAARKTLDRLMPRAYRRPVSDEELEARLHLVEEALAAGRPYDLALRPALESVLLSPHFLFRVEADGPDNAPYRIRDEELATRLSYFLWSTMPDDELMEVAGRQQLREPDELQRQVRRMVADERSRSLAENFAAQWLRFREILGLGIDFRSYPAFNNRLRRSFYDESVMFFDNLVRENRSALELIDADYAYLNGTLAAHYGVPDVEGRQLRRVALPDRRRGGVLGMGSILTVTSYPTRTSPVMRGKWVLEELLGAPPPPPPPDIPSLESVRPKRGEKLSQRERLELHRQEASCASCHQKMDPLGFALENFDGIGQWRDDEAEKPIDAQGTLAGGVELNGPEELKGVLLDRHELVMRTLVEKMFTYAVGRPVEDADEGVIRAILNKARDDDYRMMTIIEEIVGSYPFQYRRNSPEESMP